MTEFKPTWLMIKQHSVTGMKYFCKTTKPTLSQSLKYYGSGLRWKKHIAKHGKQFVTTEWISLFYDMDECMAYAIQFSEYNYIVSSDEWANLVIETGLDNGSSRPMPIEIREKISNAKKGIPLSEEHKSKLRIPHNFSYTFTDEHKKNISATKRGIVVSDEHREKIRIANTGNTHTDETKLKMSISRTGKKIIGRGKIVQQYDKNWNLLDERIVTEFTQFGFSKCRIYVCCGDNTQTHKNFHWKYKDV